MKNKQIILSLTACTLILGGISSLEAATLISNGKSDYQIVLAKGAPLADVTAANELSNYLEQITGVTLPIVEEKTDKPVIWVGQSPAISQVLGGLNFSTLRDDEIILKTVGNDLVLSGDAPRGTLYSVYELLESEFNVHFWSFEVTEVPKATTLELPQLDIRYAPELFYREGYYDTLQRNPRFAVQRRINGHCVNIPPELGGHLTLLGFCHTMDQFLPSKRYFEEHPEWYAERDGKRQDGYAQLCLTNPEVRQALLNEVLRRLREAPDTRIISVSQNDNQRYCLCDKCRAFVQEHGNQTDILIDVVNFIAESIEKEFPNVRVETLAYQYTRKAPKSVFPRKNVMIRLCSIECDFGRPLDSESNKSFSDDVKAWYKIAPVLFVWNYVTNFTKYYLPHPNWENLAGDIRFLLAHHMRGMFEQGSAGPLKVADLPEYRAFLLSKLLWNPQSDEHAITEEFMNGFYGPAAPYIEHYIEIMKAAIAIHSEYKLICYQQTTKGWLSEDALIAAWNVFQSAKARVADDPKFKQRVEFAALPVTFAILERPEMFKHPELSNIDVRKLIDKTLASAKAAGTDIFSEGGESAEGVRSRLYRYHKIQEHTGTKPEIVGNKEWMDFSAIHCLIGAGTYSFSENDPEGMNGKAARMPETTDEWAVQLRDIPTGTYSIYVELRCDNKSNATTYTAGIYNQKTKAHLYTTGIGNDIAGSKYTLVKISDRYDLDDNTYVFIAPTKNTATGNLWVNRFILIEA